MCVDICLYHSIIRGLFSLIMLEVNHVLASQVRSSQSFMSRCINHELYLICVIKYILHDIMRFLVAGN